MERPSAQYETSYGCAHSKQNGRPQRRLYRGFRAASRAEPAPSRRFFSIYDSSYRDPAVGVSQSLFAQSSGFSRNSQSKIAAFLRPSVTEGERLPRVSEYKQAFFPPRGVADAKTVKD